MLKTIKCLINDLDKNHRYTFAQALSWIPDSLYLKVVFRVFMGYPLNLKNPRTYNEKLQWLKLYDRNPFYTQLVDKYEVRRYILEKLGEEYLIPSYGVWNSFNDIPFDTLPNQFVLKCTHDCGSIIICENKANFDIETARKKISVALKKKYYYLSREWPYKNIKPRIIAEKFMTDESGVELKDYKVFCFNGVPKLIQVNYDRFTNPKKNIYDTDWNYIPVAMTYPTDPKKIISKPDNLKAMLSVAKILSKDYPTVRVDFYLIYNKIYFGELTFFPASGFGKFEPEEFDLKMGSWMNLIPSDLNGR